MAGGELRLGMTWMNMHTQSATNRRRKQEHERDLHAYNPGARRPKFVRSHSLAPIAGKKSRLASRRHRLSHAIDRSTIPRFGRMVSPFAASERFTISPSTW